MLAGRARTEPGSGARATGAVGGGASRAAENEDAGRAPVTFMPVVCVTVRNATNALCVSVRNRSVERRRRRRLRGHGRRASPGGRGRRETPSLARSGLPPSFSLSRRGHASGGGPRRDGSKSPCVTRSSSASIVAASTPQPRARARHCRLVPPPHAVIVALVETERERDSPGGRGSSMGAGRATRIRA